MSWEIERLNLMAQSLEAVRKMAEDALVERNKISMMAAFDDIIKLTRAIDSFSARNIPTEQIAIIKPLNLSEDELMAATYTKSIAQEQKPQAQKKPRVAK